MLQHRLIDPWNVNHEGHEDFPTYFWGHHCLDRCLINSSLLPELCDIQYIDFNMISGSDHRGILVNFDKSFLHLTNPNIHLMSLRDIRFNDRKQAVTYIEKFYQHCVKNNVFQSMETLQSNPSPDVQTLEKSTRFLDKRARRQRKHASDSPRRGGLFASIEFSSSIKAFCNTYVIFDKTKTFD